MPIAPNADLLTTLALNGRIVQKTGMHGAHFVSVGLNALMSSGRGEDRLQSDGKLL